MTTITTQSGMPIGRSQIEVDEVMDLIPDVMMEAVKTRVPVTFKYQGHLRYVCPFLVGRTADNKLVLHGYQYGGSGSKGPIEHPELGQWRYFYLEDVPSVMLDHPGVWYPPIIAKSETGAYVPPKFIVEVLAIHGTEVRT